MPVLLLLGASGVTGSLTARRLVEAGAHPVLVGRDPRRLAGLADRLDTPSPLGTARYEDVVDGTHPLRPGDVVVSALPSTSGAALRGARAAVQAGASHVDCCADPAYVQAVVDELGPRAVGRSPLLPAFGFQAASGVLAAELALRRAGDRGVRLHVGYFAGEGDPAPLSSGTAAALLGSTARPSYRFQGGRLRRDRQGARAVRFSLPEGRRAALTVGGLEHLTLPVAWPSLRAVEVALGWSGVLTRPVQATAAGLSLAGRLPGVGRAVALLPRVPVFWPGGDPADADVRRAAGSHVAAEVFDEAGALVAAVHLAGADAYEVTARLLALAARRLLAGDVTRTGPLDPVAALGRDALVVGVAEAGLSQV